MNAMKHTYKTLTSALTRMFVGLFVVAAIGMIIPDNALAQTTPEAGTLIGNQASATYEDAGGNSRTVTSNVVNTIVQQVAGVTVATAQSKQVSPGGQIAFPHSITNNGNGTDSFTLTAATSGTPDFTPTSINIYADANSDGIPDDFINLAGSSTPNIAAGDNFDVVIVVQVPASATSGQSTDIDLTATSDFDNGVSASLTDVITVSDNAVINVTKSMSQNSGLPGSGPYTVTLTYTNSGNTGATALQLTDQLPSGMEYVAGSGRWSETGSTALTDTDGANDDGAGITYDWNLTTAGEVTVIVDNVGAGQSGTITFEVNIAAGTQPGVLQNTAAFEYNDGTGTAGPFNSNTFNFTVLQNYDVSGTGDTVADATQGATVSFTNTFTNDGNATDRYNITVANDGTNPFPAGSSFILYKSDGVSPLLDTNNDGTPDTGPVAPGDSYEVILKVTLPNSATGGGPYQYNKTATSVNDGTTTVTVVDELTTITGSTVDLTENAVLGDGSENGAGDGPEGTAVATNTVDPGVTTTFTLFANNTSSVSDNYDIAVDTDTDFSSTSLPSGVTVTFKDAGGSVIGNTGTINGGASKQITMEITLPDNAPPTTNSYYVRIKSPGTNAEDIIHLAVDVNTVREITISPNNSGQIFPGGSVTYTHTVKNSGNVTENVGGAGESEIALTLSNSNSGFSATMYLDSDNDGEIDTGEPIIDEASDLGSLTAGQSKQIIVKVTASPGVSDGLNNTTTVTATTTGQINSINAPVAVTANDVTTVIASNVSLIKRQALNDTNNDGNPVGSFSRNDINADPGETVLYQIKIKNLGTTPISDVEINDAIPPFTSYDENGTYAAAVTKGTVAYNATSETLTATIGTLAAGEEVTFTFGVTIDN